MKLHYTLTLAFAACLPHAASAAGKGPTSPSDLSRDAVPVSTADSTSLRCYFQKSGSPTVWYWGLTRAKLWYALPGTWQKTQFTKIETFFSATTLEAITQACTYAQTYHQLDGYTLLAAFAAQSKVGSNYPIIIGGTTELWPQY